MSKSPRWASVVILLHLTIGPYTNFKLHQVTGVSSRTEREPVVSPQPQLSREQVLFWGPTMFQYINLAIKLTNHDNNWHRISPWQYPSGWQGWLSEALPWQAGFLSGPRGWFSTMDEKKKRDLTSASISLNVRLAPSRPFKSNLFEGCPSWSSYMCNQDDENR